MQTSQLTFVGVIALSLGTPIAAQIAPAAIPPVQSAPTPIAAQVTDRAILRTGTEVPLRLLEELTTQGKKLRVGQRIRLETAEPILVQGVTVVPAGSPAMGELTDVVNKGMWGKSGHLSGRVLYLNVNGRQIRLSGAFDDKGVAGGIGAVAVSAIVFLPAGFFMTGTSARLPAGTVVKGFIDEDVPLEIAAAGPTPLAVTAPGTVTGSTPLVAPAGGTVSLSSNPAPMVPAAKQ